MKLFITICAIVSLTMVGCKQNPYAGIYATPGQKVVINNPDNEHQTPNVFSIEAPDLLECTESVVCSTQILGHVPKPGSAIVKITGLPAGATFDSKTGELTFTPGFDVVNISEHPEQSMVLFPLNISVRSSADAVNETSRTITLLVKNKMQPVEIVVTGDSEVNEGETLEQTVEVKSVDFPQGPFSLAAINAPVGTSVEAVSGSSNLFKVKYTPSFLTTGYYSNASFNVTYNASLPIGSAITKFSNWKVVDVRQAPLISAPETITQGLDVSFYIRAEDLNGEDSPKIEVNSTVPFGRIVVGSAVNEPSGKRGSFPSSTVMVRWDQLNTSHLGKKTKIEYEVCVQRICTQKFVMIELKADLHPAPKIDRSNWKLGDLKFLRVGTPFTISLPIFDVEDQSMPVSVKVNSSQTNAVTWKNNTLTITPKAEGFLQFGIQAESIFAQKFSEDFIVEVLPASWAKTILFADDLIQNESLETAKLITSNEILSVKHQSNDRDLALRESCVLTTEAINSSKFDEALENRIYQKVSFMLVSSPLVKNLKGKIESDLKEFGIKIEGRLSKVIPQASISSFTLAVDPRSGLESTKVPAGLNGKLSSESVDPLILDLSHMKSNCTPLFNLQKPATSLAVGVTCKQKDGKILTILGFEIADVLLSQGDVPILKKWMKVFLTGEVN